MSITPLSLSISDRLTTAACKLRTANPNKFIAGLIEDSFPYAGGDARYAKVMALGSSPFEPKLRTAQGDSLAFSLEPLGPDAPSLDRRDLASREVRRLVRDNFGREALHWFDKSSESQRGIARNGGMNFGAFFGSSYDSKGLQTTSVTYEGGAETWTVNPALARLIGAALSAMPGARPVFTTLVAGRDYGSQWVTFLLTNAFRLTELQPMLDELGLGSRLASILQVVGIALGGRFDIPPGAALIAFGRGPSGVEVELQVMLDAIPDVPPNFLQLLTMNLRERPSQLAALERFLEAFTPEDNVWPGRFSVLGIRIGVDGPAKISLFLRPVDFEIVPAAALVPDLPVPVNA
jgi:hypothetical protein